MIRFQFVDDHRSAYEVKRMCAVLGIQRSSYYKWCSTRTARAQRQVADELLVEKIWAHHKEWDRTYGYRRITAELADAPEVDGPVNHKRGARLMRQHNTVGVDLRRRHVTTVKDPGAQVFADLVKRDFTATEVGAKYGGDISY